MSDRNGTFRAMFLVAIMVLSVVAIGAVFAGTAVADDSEPEPDPGEVLALDDEGTELEGFDNIGDAIQEEIGDEEVDRVLVGPDDDGPYEESITIDVDGLTLESSEGAEETTIVDDAPLRIEADNVVVDGFGIVDSNPGGENRGIKLDEGTGVTIQNNEFEGFRTQITMDFAGDDPADVTIQTNNFSDGGVAIGSTEDVEGLDIKNNNFDGVFNGVSIGDGANDVDITGNDFQNIENRPIGIVPSGLDVDFDENTFDQRIEADEYSGFEDAVFSAFEFEIDGTEFGILNAVEEGATIEVGPGTYEESVTVDENVTILSDEGPDETTIINDAEDSSSTVDIRSDNVIFAGFTVERQNGEDYSQGVAVRDNDTLVADNIITESDRGTDRATTQGILVTDTDGETSDIFIQENEISGFGEGVALSTQDEGGISDAFIDANSITDVEIGVKVSDFSGTEEDISGIIFDNTIENNDYGVFVFGDEEDANLGGDDVDGVASIDDLAIFNNNIVGNDVGVINNGDDTLFAVANWWGDALGPDADGNDLDTTGDSIEGDVFFDPWLNAEFDDDPDEVSPFEIEIDETNAPVEEGDDLEVELTVENIGDGDDITQTVELLDFDGDVVDSTDVELDFDESESPTLVWETDTVGTDDITVQTLTGGDTLIDDDTTEVEIEEAPAATTGTGTGTTASPPSVSATITKSISDESPDTDGTTVSVNLGALNSITFSDEAASGMVEVEELSEVPATGPQLSDDQPFIAGSTITVPDEQADQPATLELSTNADRLDEVGADADDLVVLRAGSGAEEFETLDTEVEEENGEFTVTAETPGFSTFILSTDDGETDDEQEDDTDAEAEPEPEDEAEPVDDGVPGFGAVVALVALLGAALLAVRARQNA